MVVAPRVYIHIGQPKTGSTALQKAMAAHPRELATAGVIYPVADGREDHRGEIADLLVPRTTPTDINRPGHARLVRDAVPGSWERLVERVATADRQAVVSDETLSGMPLAAAQRVVSDLTTRSPERATVVLAVRPVSDLLASVYAQLTQDTLVPGFEMWTRTWLRARVRHTAFDKTVDWTDGFRVAGLWKATGAEVVCVEYRSNSARFWNEMFSALGLAEVHGEISIPRANPSMSALGLAAWQQYLRSGADPHAPATKRLRKAARADIPEVSDATLGGRLSLTPELAEMVDAAFPQPPSGAFADATSVRNAREEATQPAVARLEERLRDPAPLTTQPLEGRSAEVSALALRIAELARHP